MYKEVLFRCKENWTGPDLVSGKQAVTAASPARTPPRHHTGCVRVASPATGIVRPHKCAVTPLGWGPVLVASGFHGGDGINLDGLGFHCTAIYADYRISVSGKTNNGSLVCARSPTFRVSFLLYYLEVPLYWHSSFCSTGGPY